MTTGEIIPVTNKGIIGLLSPQGPEVTGVRDTTVVTGAEDHLPLGTMHVASNKDTVPAGGSRKIEPSPPPISNRGFIGNPPGDEVSGVSDTTGAVGANDFHPISTELHKTVDTLQPGQIGKGHADPAYRPPSLFVPVNIRDTTLTDVQPGGSTSNPVPKVALINGTLETMNIGALGSGHGLTPPSVPSDVEAYNGPRLVIVTWEGSDDVEGDPTLGYTVMGSTGGTTHVPANRRHAIVRTLDPSRSYTFRVLATNKAGNSEFSSRSGLARPYNPDELDVLKPSGLSPANRREPIYRPDGTIMPGTGGTSL